MNKFGFQSVPGNGRCIDENNQEGAFYMRYGKSFDDNKSVCGNDLNCIAFSYSFDTGIAIIYTTNSELCVENCDFDKWQEDPHLIVKADYESKDFQFSKCYVKGTTRLCHGVRRC